MNLQNPKLIEFERRQQVRGSFLRWCQEAGYEPAKHHRLIIQELETLVSNLFEALLRGHEVSHQPLRLMVLTPPGSAKSTYISKLFPPWFLAQCHRLQLLMTKADKRYEPLGILACTHNGDLSVEFGGAARNLVEANQQLLGYGLNKDSRASDAWSCSNGGYYRAGTVGSGISGRRMHLGLVDDFCGKEEDATSKLINDKIWVWWENDFVNRLQPIAARVIIANHRNEDDLVGRLLVKEPSKWRIIRLRLLIETQEQADEDPLGRKVGEYLWPEYFTEAQVKERMSNPRASGIQQQQPSPESGDIFKAEWLIGYNENELPTIHDSSGYGASDHAVRTKTINDETCIGTSRFRKNLIYIHPDLIWGRIPTNIQVKEMLRLMKQMETVFWWGERENISGAIGPFLRDQQMEQQIFNAIQEIPTRGKDKIAMAQPIIGLMSMGLVRFPFFAPWWSRARYQLLKFPNGKNDDFVTFISLIGRGIQHMVDIRQTTRIIPQFDPSANVGMNITMRSIKEQKARERREHALLDR